MKRLKAGLILIGAVLILIGALQLFELSQYLTLEGLKSRQAFYTQLYQDNPLLLLTGYFLLLMSLTALSIPGLSVVMLAGGALFGFPVTLLVVSFSDVIGSMLAFLGSRYLFGNHLQRRYPGRLHAIDSGVAREGAYYLLTLRLIPIFPCFLINLMMGLTRIRTTTFYWATQIGKLPHNAIYVNAGAQIGKIDSIPGIVTPELLFSFVLIGIFPLLARKWIQSRKGKKGIALIESR
jgi:uncharacterized membrane protein YdjX (TVP38/TMEM64 family)